MSDRISLIQKRIENYSALWWSNQVMFQESIERYKRRRVHHIQWIGEQFFKKEDYDDDEDEKETFIRLSRRVVRIFDQSKATTSDEFVEYVTSLGISEAQKFLLCIFFSAVYKKIHGRHWTIGNDYSVEDFSALMRRYLAVVAEATMTMTMENNDDGDNEHPKKPTYFCSTCNLHFQYQGRWEQHQASKYHAIRVDKKAGKRQRKD